MLKQNLSQKLLQKLSPQQIQFIKLLQLNTLSFQEKLEDELIENPALEMDDHREDYDSNEHQNDEDYSDEFSDDYSSKDDDTFDISDYYNENEGGIQLSGDYSREEEKYTPQNVHQSSFREILQSQLHLVINPKQELLASQIIGSLDDDGYLRRPLSAIKNDLLFQFNVQCTLEELEEVLLEIHELDPPGIGARDLQECLLLQIKRKQEDSNGPVLKLAYMIVDECMEDFSKKHFKKIVKKLNITEDYLKEALELIKKLNPKPAQSGFDSLLNRDFVIPDFNVRENNSGELEISLNNHNTPELKVNKDFAEALKGYELSEKKSKSQKEAIMYIKQKLDSANWFIDAVKQRQNTLLKTIRKIVEIQEDFFRSGDFSDLKPMILKDIADGIEMDISTISRVASSKYVETPFGIFLLKEFFSEGITTQTGEEVSSIEVKELIKTAVKEENKKSPLTDEALMKYLKEKGYPIARRTVAKYREQLNIPVARLRKTL
jgi:RNA polymerase sigma-54 factor